MKIKALTAFNLGSMEANYHEGDTLRVSAATGKELVEAGLAEAYTGDEPESADEAEADEKEDAAAKGRKTKPEPAVITTK